MSICQLAALAQFQSEAWADRSDVSHVKNGITPMKRILCTECRQILSPRRRVRYEASSEKTCIKCKKLLAISDFGFDQRSSDGHAPICRQCNSIKAQDILRKKRLSQPGKQIATARLSTGRHQATRQGNRSDNISIDNLAGIWDRQSGSCFWCKQPLNPFRDCHIDHIVAISKGGGHSLENIVFSCAMCNQTKNDGKNAFNLYLRQLKEV